MCDELEKGIRVWWHPVQPDLESTGGPLPPTREPALGDGRASLRIAGSSWLARRFEASRFVSQRLAQKAL